MLITKLVEYARNEGLTEADPFFEAKPIRWLVVITPEGRFVHLLRLGGDNRGKDGYTVPKKSGGNAGGVATFATDNPRFVLGYTENAADARKAERDLPAFIALIDQAADEQPAEPDFAAMAAFYADSEQVAQARAAAAENKVKDGDRVAIALTTGQNIPIFDSTASRNFWRSYRAAQESSKKAQGAVLCLACGQEKPPVLTADKLMGVPDGQPSGTTLLSFDKGAFQSFGWEKNQNAPVCADCSFAYTRGLNHLLDRSNVPRTRLDQAGVAFVFWLDSGSAGEFVSFFEQPDSKEAEAILAAARTGRLPATAPGRELFVLGLRGNGGRAVVTEWFETALAEAYANLARWFADLEVQLLFDEKEKGITYRTAGQNARPPRLWVLCRATARDDDDILDRTPADILRAALRGEPLPLSIVQACISRLPLDGFGDFFTPARIGLIRCALNRRNPGERNLMPGLDQENDHPAYLCGRLLATLEAIQYAGVGDVGANIIDRYYGKASTAPALVFGPLMTLAQSHLGAINNDGQRVNLDRELQAIFHKLEPNLPRTLSPEDQGRFAIGYYHQKAYRFAELQRRKDARAIAAKETEE